MADFALPLSKFSRFLDTTWELLELPVSLRDKLERFDNCLEESIAVEMDDGTEKYFPAFRIQHSNVRGPYKGGVRFHPEVDKKTVQELSFEMSLKSAVVDIPVGGGKGGVCVDAKKLSSSELERLARAYVRMFFSHIGPEKDVPAPDVGTDAKVMGVMLDEYERLAKKSALGAVTGKPVAIGGSKAREYATAQGGFFVLSEIAKRIGITKGASVSVQGFGNAGFHIARILSEAGYRIVSVSDSKGVLLNEEGLDVMKVQQVKKEKGSVCDSKEEGRVVNEQPVWADVFIPAALSDSVTKEFAERLESTVVLELANSPLTDEADSVLCAKEEVVVVPDILANAGGVVVSYFEQVQNASNFFWKEEEVLKKLEDKLREATDCVWEQKEKYDITLRQAAINLAVTRLVDAFQARELDFG